MMKKLLIVTAALFACAGISNAQEAGSSSIGKFMIPNTPPPHDAKHLPAHQAYAKTTKVRESSTGMFMIPNTAPSEVAGERSAHDAYVRNLHDSGLDRYGNVRPAL
jgi:hypothetical protein